MTSEVQLIVRWGALLLTAFVLQIGVFTDLKLFGVHPEILLLVAICAGLVGGPDQGCRGRLRGRRARRPGASPGCSASRRWRSRWSGSRWARPRSRSSARRCGISIAIAVAASAVGTLLYAAVGEMLGQRSLSDPRLWAIVGIVSAVNGLLCVPGLAVCRWAEGEPVRARSY